jgi:hypothetical protein
MLDSGRCKRMLAGVLSSTGRVSQHMPTHEPNTASILSEYKSETLAESDPIKHWRLLQTARDVSHVEMHTAHSPASTSPDLTACARQLLNLLSNFDAKRRAPCKSRETEKAMAPLSCMHVGKPST